MSVAPPRISRVIVPPLWMAIGLAIEIVVGRWWPLVRLIPWPFRWAGVVPIVAGVALAVWARGLFVRAKTGVVPFSESTALVATGPYRYTRNPMYLGMTLVLAGAALLTGALSALFVPPAFMIVITYLFIRYEEHHMHAAMGASYDELKRSVRRWL